MMEKRMFPFMKAICLSLSLLPLLCGCGSPAPVRSFLYAGESPVHRMYIVEDGKVVWEYVNEEGRGEISDAMLLDDGNILMAHQHGIAIVSPAKEIVWSYPAPEGCEIHTVQPVGKDHLVFVQNGDPAKVRVIRKSDKETVREFPLPVEEPVSVHGQFRNARLTGRGTLLVANMGLGFVGEYSSLGEELRRWEVPSPWGVESLPGGNILVASNKCTVTEFTLDGEVAWRLDLGANPDYYGVTSGQKAYRLPSGNTVIGNWVNYWNSEEREAVSRDPENAPVQFIEVNPEGEIIWTLRSWADPDLGPSTTYQPTDSPLHPDRMFFGDIK